MSDLRHARDKAEPESPEHEQDRVRDPDELCRGEQQQARGEQSGQ